MAEFDPSGRFQVLDSPVAAPGKCAVCGYSESQSEEGRVDKRKYIDFGFDLDYYGVVYICSDCLHTLATMFGYLKPEDADIITQQSADVNAENIRLHSAVEVINGVADVLTRGGWLIPGDNSNVVSGEPKSEEDVSHSGTNDSEPAEQVVKSGPDDLRSLDSLSI